MKDWFPLTDYEFYAYVSTGMFLVAAVDYTVGGEILLQRTEWTVVQVIFWVIAAYFAGHLVAAPAAGLLEHLVARRLLRPPAEIQIGDVPRRRHESIVAWLFAQREYAPFRPDITVRIRNKAATLFGKSAVELDAETIFTVAYPVARRSADAVARMNQFQNLYSVFRNVAFVALLSIGLLGYRYHNTHDPHVALLLAVSAVFAIGAFGRFMKFYSAFSAEVLRTYCATDD